MRPIEREMAEIPGRAMKLYGGEPFAETLRMLAAEKEQADPDWLAARLENMLLTNGIALSRMRGLLAEAEALLRQYRQLPDADPQTLSAFQVSGVLTLKSQVKQLEENDARFRELLRTVKSAKKQRAQISLLQAIEALK